MKSQSHTDGGGAPGQIRPTARPIRDSLKLELDPKSQSPSLPMAIPPTTGTTNTANSSQMTTRTW